MDVNIIWWCSVEINCQCFSFPFVPLHPVMATLAADPTFIEGFIGVLQKLGTIAQENLTYLTFQ